MWSVLEQYRAAAYWIYPLSIQKHTNYYLIKQLILNKTIFFIFWRKCNWHFPVQNLLLLCQGVVFGCQGIVMRLLGCSEWLLAFCYAIARVFWVVAGWLLLKLHLCKNFFFFYLPVKKIAHLSLTSHISITKINITKWLKFYVKLKLKIKKANSTY